MSDLEHSGSSREPHSAFEPPRRGFLTRFLAGAIGLVVGVVPVLTGAAFFLDPLLRRRKGADVEGTAADGARVVKDADGFIRLDVTLDALPEDGTPQRVTVFDDLINVWNMTPNQPVGSVWLRKIAGQVLAFNTICPHLGCAVEHRSAEGDFYCPCHTSAFNLDGERNNEIPPRAMDALEVKLLDGRVWLKYQEFRGATSEKVPV